MRILIIEDEYTLADVISTRLEKAGHETDIYTDGEEGYSAAVLEPYDLIILDVMLPSMDGFEILEKLRKQGITSKIIMLTARSTIQDKVDGLKSGANDYMTKPFHIDELLTRVEVQLRTPTAPPKNLLEFGDLSLDLSTSTLTNLTTKDSVELVKKEQEILELFLESPATILKKPDIYLAVWGTADSESNNLEVYLSFIRKKLKAIGSTTNIKAVRGLGYRLEKQDAKTPR